MPDKRNYTFHPGREFQLNWDALNEMYTDGDENQCYIVVLDGRSIAYLQAMTSIFPLYHWLWGLPSPKRNWDQGTIDKWDTIQKFVSEVNDCLMSGCNVSDLVTAIEGLTASLNYDNKNIAQITTENGVTMASAASLIASKLDHDSQGIAEIIANWSDRTNVNLTDLIDEIEAQTTLADDVQDALYFLKLFRDLLPNLSVPLPDLIAIWEAMLMMRYRHNDLTIKGYQATSLRHIGNALAPVVESQSETEESIVKGLIQEIERIPWLTAAVVSIFDPSPSGEIALVAKIGLTAKSLYDKAASMWVNFRDAYINQVGDPQPQATVVGMLNEIAERLAGVGGNIGLTVDVLSDCSDCGPETTVNGPAQSFPADSYRCDATKWYIGMIAEKFYRLTYKHIQSGEPSVEFEGDSSTGGLDDAYNWYKDGLYRALSGGKEAIVDVLEGISGFITSNIDNIQNEISTVFVFDWGIEARWPQDLISNVLDTIIDGVDYVDQDTTIKLDPAAFLAAWLDNQQDIMDVIFNASDAQGAKDDLAAYLYTVFPSDIQSSTNINAAIHSLIEAITSQNTINRIFIDGDLSTAEISRYSWRVSATCPAELIRVECEGRTYSWGWGSPNYTTETEFFSEDQFVIASEWDLATKYKVTFQTGYDIGIRVTDLDHTATVTAEMADCNFVISACNDIAPGLLPTDYAGGVIDFYSDDPFTITFELIGYDISNYEAGC